MRERGEVASNLHVLLELRLVVATDDDRADRVRQSVIHRVSHGHHTRARGNRRTFPGVLLRLQRRRRPA